MHWDTWGLLTLTLKESTDNLNHSSNWALGEFTRSYLPHNHHYTNLSQSSPSIFLHFALKQTRFSTKCMTSTLSHCHPVWCAYVVGQIGQTQWAHIGLAVAQATMIAIVQYMLAWPRVSAHACTVILTHGVRASLNIDSGLALCWHNPYQLLDVSYAFSIIGCSWWKTLNVKIKMATGKNPLSFAITNPCPLT